VGRRLDCRHRLHLREDISERKYVAASPALVPARVKSSAVTNSFCAARCAVPLAVLWCDVATGCGEGSWPGGGGVGVIVTEVAESDGLTIDVINSTFDATTLSCGSSHSNTEFLSSAGGAVGLFLYGSRSVDTRLTIDGCTMSACYADFGAVPCHISFVSRYLDSPCVCLQLPLSFPRPLSSFRCACVSDAP
jgi:hypothetical protein